MLDATTLEVLADESLEGFNRLNPAGDGRHFLVSTQGGFQLLDGGAWAEPHGDHDHYYTADPQLTDVVFPAETPGHVVAHAGRTVLFDDGTGDVTAFDSAHVADDDLEPSGFSTPDAHHGVAVELTDGTMLVSDGTEDSRSGVRILDADGEEIAARDDCPSVHGETVAAGEAVGYPVMLKIAEAFGGIGMRVKHLDDLAPAVDKALAAGVPACINAEIEPGVVHPITTMMLGDVTSTDEIVVPYYENLPR